MPYQPGQPENAKARVWRSPLSKIEIYMLRIMEVISLEKLIDLRLSVDGNRHTCRPCLVEHIVHQILSNTTMTVFWLHNDVCNL